MSVGFGLVLGELAARILLGAPQVVTIYAAERGEDRLAERGHLNRARRRRGRQEISARVDGQRRASKTIPHPIGLRGHEIALPAERIDRARVKAQAMRTHQHSYARAASCCA